MTEIDRGKLASLAGFATPAVLLVLTAAALVDGTFGWRGGAYLLAFFWIALGSAVAGGLVRVAAPDSWRSAGSGMVLAGTTGVVLFVVLVGAFLWALSTFTP
ncbi:hypothetical protein [Lentzea sp. NPDC059081]|uniref:hypothetical protein n=1 Tax=Lentzea sp. NPDC059081 TaxID=3346719 RepID=UPI0036ACD519